MKWLQRRGWLADPSDADASNAQPELSAAEVLARAGTERGTLQTVRELGAGSEQDDPAAIAPPPRVSDAAVHQRFNLHASVHLEAQDFLGRERLCRYLARPALSVARLRRRRDGNFVYRVKKVSRHRVTERIMTPVETLARLAALVAPPRYPLLRFHGVLASHHRLRRRIVPKPPSSPRRCHKAELQSQKQPPAPAPAETKATPAAGPRDDENGPGLLDAVRPSPEGASELCAGGVAALLVGRRLNSAEQLGPNVLSIAHWKHLLFGELYASSSRLDWRTLLKRTFQVDLRVCPRCSGRLEIRATVTNPLSVARLLAALRRPRAPPRVA